MPPTRKSYSGRLAFDSDTGFHVDSEGKPVVTLDGGATWSYAEADDPSHIEQYHQNFASVDSTANRLMELQLEHGRDKASELMVEEFPHHFVPLSDDPHAGGVKFSPDKVAETETSHTATYAKAENNE